MKRLFIGITYLIVLAGYAGSNSLAVAEESVRVWIKHRSGVAAKIQQSLNQSGAKILYRFPEINAYTAVMPASVMKILAKNPNIQFIEEDPKRYLYSQSVPYGIDLIQAREVWDANNDSNIDTGAPTGQGITVCIIDSGIYAGHEDFAGVPLNGTSDSSAGSWNVDNCGHGTHVAGTVAAANNTSGVVGVSPGKIAVHSVKVFGDNCGWAYSSSLVNAATQCRINGAKVISMSLGGGRKSSTEENFFNQLYNSYGILSVAAAGNSGNTSFSYPASYSSVISVAAVNSSKQIASFSQQNSQVELAAPGVAILSTVPWSNSGNSGGYETWSGTSMATPHIAGAAALVWSAFPNKSNNDIRLALQSTALDLGANGRDNAYGYGLVQVADAVQYLGGGSGGGGSTFPSPTPSPSEPPASDTDTTGPVISGVSSSKQFFGNFTIRWTTDEPSTSTVVFTCCGTFNDTALTTSHSMSFRGTRRATYTYDVESVDAAGNKSVSGPYTHIN